MGIIKSKLCSPFGKKSRFSVLVIGLDNGGKTTVLSHILPPRRYFLNSHFCCYSFWQAPKRRDSNYEDIIFPTCGLESHECRIGKDFWVVNDMSGQGRYRSVWKEYYGSNGIVFVVDASNILRLGKVKEEFSNFINHKSIQLNKPPVLILVNKMDHATDSGNKPASVGRISHLLSLKQREGQNFKIIQTNGLTGEGVHAGMMWLNNEMVGQK